MKPEFENLPQIMEPRCLRFDPHGNFVGVYEDRPEDFCHIPDWYLIELIWFMDGENSHYQAVLRDPESGGKIRAALTRDQATAAVLIYNELQRKQAQLREYWFHKATSHLDHFHGPTW